MTASTPLRQRMLEDMQLHGFAAKTQDAYVRAGKQLAEYYHQSPELISEEQLRQYLLYLQNEKHVAASTFTIALCGLKFFYERTLQRTWRTFELARPVPEKKLPVVLSIEEVHEILSRLHRPRYRVWLTTIYACGLRLREGVYLHGGDMDSARQLLHIRHGKGGQDRSVPLPGGALQLLRQYWSLHRHPVWLFPAPAHAGRSLASATQPMDERSVQRAFRAALQASGIPKAASGPYAASFVCDALTGSGRRLASDSSLPGPPFPADDRAVYSSHPTDRTARHRSDQSRHGGTAVVELADIFRHAKRGPAYRAKFGDRLLPRHRHTRWTIEHGRTEALGGHVYHCPDCDQSVSPYHSCRNRHCPKCQNEQAQHGLEQQRDLLLPVPYFMLTFTLPAPLRSMARSHQARLYDLRFRASASAAQPLAADPRFIGGQLGRGGVWPTWGRTLTYHPHVHYLIPAGGLADDDQTWRPARDDFLVPVKALSGIFRARFRDALRSTELFDQVPASVWESDGVVHCKAVGHGETAFKYLAPYILPMSPAPRAGVGRCVAWPSATAAYSRSRTITSPFATVPRIRVNLAPARWPLKSSAIASCNTSCLKASSRCATRAS